MQLIRVSPAGMAELGIVTALQAISYLKAMKEIGGEEKESHQKQ